VSKKEMYNDYIGQTYGIKCQLGQAISSYYRHPGAILSHFFAAYH
jgi:hypothetical protein